MRRLEGVESTVLRRNGVGMMGRMAWVGVVTHNAGGDAGGDADDKDEEQ